MDRDSRQKAQLALGRAVGLIEQALAAPTVPSVWKLAAGALLEGFNEAKGILAAPDDYGSAFVYTSLGGPHHELLTTTLEAVPLFPKRNLTDIPDVIAQGIDGGFLPDTNTEGIAKVQVIENFTVVAFADRSADRRAGSHSTFVLSGVYPAETGIARAQELFASLFTRYQFEVVLQV